MKWHVALFSLSPTYYVGTLRCRSGEIVEMLERRTVHFCRVNEIRFRGNSTRMFSGKSAEYKLFWIGNWRIYRVGISLSKKWVNTVIDISRVSDKALVQGIIISVVSVYTHSVIARRGEEYISQSRKLQ